MGENVKMSVSSVVKKNGQKHIYVQFAEDDKIAEATLPDKKIIYNEGFSEEEIAVLETYIRSEENTIVEMAKNINPINAFMKK